MAINPQDDLDDYCRKVDLKLKRQFKTAENKALIVVEDTETLLKRHPKVYAYELRQIERMKAYIHKYKFLPDSYSRMLYLWSIYYKANYRT